MKRRILQVLQRNNEPRSVDEIATELGTYAERAYNAVRDLIEAGEVKRVKRCKGKRVRYLYFATPRGLRANVCVMKRKKTRWVDDTGYDHRALARALGEAIRAPQVPQPAVVHRLGS